MSGALDSIAIAILAAVPGQPGRKVRGVLMRHFLGSLGPSTVLQPGLSVTSPRRVRIGAHCNLAQRVSIVGDGGVTIGDWVGFGPDVKVWSMSYRFEDPDRPWMLQGVDLQPVVVEDDVWLGANVFVAPGVTIGKGAIVSASAVVSKSVPPFAIVAGNPGRVVGWRKAPEATANPAPAGAAVSTAPPGAAVQP